MRIAAQTLANHDEETGWGGWGNHRFGFKCARQDAADAGLYRVPRITQQGVRVFVGEGGDRGWGQLCGLRSLRKPAINKIAVAGTKEPASGDACQVSVAVWAMLSSVGDDE